MRDKAELDGVPAAEMIGSISSYRKNTGPGSRGSGPFAKDIEYVFRVTGEKCTALSDRRKQVLQYGFEPSFYRHVAKATPTIPRFQLSDGSSVFVKSIEIGESHVPLNCSRIARAKVVRIGIHLKHGLPNFIG